MSWETEVEALAKAMKTEQTETSRTYQATVSRIDSEGRAWVRVAGSDKETPTESRTTGVQKGDTVTIEWRNNRLYIAGNTSDPAVGETRVGAVAEAANKAQEAAELVGKVVELINQYFWHTESGQDSGVHITEIPKEDFVKDPAHGGGNLLARSNGVALRDGLTELASFGASETVINASDGSRVVISPNCIDLQDEYHASLFKAWVANGKAYIRLDNGGGEPLLMSSSSISLFAGAGVRGGSQDIVISSPSSGGNSAEMTLSHNGNLDISGDGTCGITVNGSQYLVATEHTMTAPVNVLSGDYTTYLSDASKSGYYPLGIVGWRLENGSGSGSSYGFPYRLRLSSVSTGSATISAAFRAIGGNVNNCTLYVTILWRKI